MILKNNTVRQQRKQIELRKDRNTSTQRFTPNYLVNGCSCDCIARCSFPTPHPIWGCNIITSSHEKKNEKGCPGLSPTTIWVLIKTCVTFARIDSSYGCSFLCVDCPKSIEWCLSHITVTNHCKTYCKGGI